nr:MAG TPA: Head to tail joining protein [Bacteriophage sp.]
MSTPQDGQRTTAKQLYAKLESTRKVYTDRAEKCAELTIPMAFPKESDTSSTKYETPYQSIGARGVNNLTSKLMLALFPPNAPFFRLSLGDEVRTQLGDDPATVQEWERALSKIERQITNYMESHQMRVTTNEAMTQLIITGNVLLFLPPKEGGMKLYRLNSYCLSRDGIGNTTEIVTKESIAYGALPPEAQRCIEGDNIEPHKAYDVYTHTYLDGEVYRSYQEVGDNIIPGTEQTYPKDASPWIPLRLRKMDGESYGRSFVDEYLGDLKALEALSKSVTEVAAIASNIIFLVNPNAQTRISELQKAKPGDFVRGRLEDITALQINKTGDLQVTTAAVQSIEARLSYAFLLNSAVQRNAERVTAEEIRYVARELEDTVGNIYSILARELQLPLVRRFMNQMTGTGAIPDLPQGSRGVEPTITTGIEALGRGHDLAKLDTFIRYAQVFPEAFQTAVKQNEILSQIATALGLDASSVVKSEQEIEQEQQQAMQMQMAQQLVPQAMQQQ